jgi:uncharacterized membrane protein YgcG
MRRCALFIIALLVAAPAAAQERITSYDTDIQIRADGSIDVTEQIAVRAEGNQIRRGIYRDFPTRYRDRLGNRVRVQLEVLGVERNGVMEPWFTERMNNGVRINTGNDDFLPVPADYTFTIRYRTTRQLGFFEGFDELYWNAIGTGWIFPIEKGSVEIRLPAPVPTDSMRLDAYTGPQGAQGKAAEATASAPGVARYQLTAPLAPYEGLTVVLGFPKGIVREPTDADRTRLFFSDNKGALTAVAGFLFLLLYTFRQWRAVGRDPQKGVVIARYEPGEGQTPAGLRYMMKMGYDVRCFTADILALAVGGHVRIDREDKFLKDEWSLVWDGAKSDAAANPPPAPAQKRLLVDLFRGAPGTLVLKNTNAGLVSKAKQEHQKALDKEFHPRYFKRNTKQLLLAVLIVAVTMAVSLIISGGFAIPVIIGLGALMIIIVAVFGFLVRAPTPEGRALLDEIEGLKLYMKVAEKQELASMRGPDEPPLDAKRYEAMLPYAVALEVEDAWTDKFTAAVGAAAAVQATQHMTWYRGQSIANIGDFTSSVSSGLNSTISSASTPPGSSSGGGGGGFSGGGGGGGGGGGR